MKKSKSLILSLAFVLLGTATTFAANPITNPNEIRQEIADLVQTIDVSNMENDSERVTVQFIVNSDNELVVLNVSESDFDYNIKAKLNYKKVKTEDVVRNKLYSVPVVFKKS